MTLRDTFYLMAVSLSTLSFAVHAEVVLDGTLGASGALPGPDFVVDASFGQQVGSNLFHSFESFNLNSTESANFTGPADISNVISRVTGGQPSFIDGILRSFVPNADLYFLNPQGIMFGPNAALNIPGSLYASTADYLKLGETGRFDVTTPSHSLLTVAPPSAFGFLDNIPAGITVEGSPLILPNDEMMGRIFNGEDVAITTLGLVGGNITIKDAQIVTYGNDVDLVSVASQGEVPIDPTTLTDDTFAAYGTLSITDTGAFDRLGFGNIDVSGFGGGEIYIRAGQFFLDNGWVFADTWRNKAGRGITVHANDALTMKNGSRITTDALNFFDDRDLLSPLWGFNPNFTGNGGSITITASNVSLTDGSQIQSSSRTAGNAGNISLFAQNTLSLKGQKVVIRNTDTTRSGVLAFSLNTGAGGEMSISANVLNMEDGATMRAETWGFGDAGNLSIEANTLSLSNGSQINVSTGHLTARQGTGKAGKLAVVANESVSIGGGEGKSSLSSSTFTQGQGGTIEITSPDVTVHEKGSIQANSLQEGDAGSIVLNVDTLNLTQDGFISAAAYGNGLGGDIEVQAQKIRFSEGGYIAASSLGEGDAGNIILNLGDKLTMRGDSFIRTAAKNADGGNISITAQNYLYLIDSRISTSVGSGFGGGGNITMRQEFVVQDESPIIAEAYGGPGGNINITTTGIYKFSLASLNNRISASSQYGVDGIVTIETPDNSAEEEVVILTTDLLDASGLLDTPCGQRVSENLSRFLLTPSEGISNAMTDLLASGPLLSQLEPIVKQEVKPVVFQKDKHFNIVDKYYVQNRNFATCQW
jgi:filamentous hemagglutinin family protein